MPLQTQVHRQTRPDNTRNSSLAINDPEMPLFMQLRFTFRAVISPSHASDVPRKLVPKTALMKLEIVGKHLAPIVVLLV